MRTCLIAALAAGLLGVGLRAALPVSPVDEPFREVLRFYRSVPLAPSGRPERAGSNTGETRAPY